MRLGSGCFVCGLLRKLLWRWRWCRHWPVSWACIGAITSPDAQDVKLLQISHGWLLTEDCARDPACTRCVAFTAPRRFGGLSSRWRVEVRAPKSKPRKNSRRSPGQFEFTGLRASDHVCATRCSPFRSRLWEDPHCLHEETRAPSSRVRVPEVARTCDESAAFCYALPTL